FKHVDTACLITFEYRKDCFKGSDNFILEFHYRFPSVDKLVFQSVDKVSKRLRLVISNDECCAECCYRCNCPSYRTGKYSERTANTFDNRHQQSNRFRQTIEPYEQRTPNS